MPYRPDTKWKMDPVLEISVDPGSTGAVVRLCGVLDGQTDASLRAIVKELIDEGFQDVSVELGGLTRIDEAGFSALTSMQEDARLGGGMSCGPDVGAQTRDREGPTPCAYGPRGVDDPMPKRPQTGDQS